MFEHALKTWGDKMTKAEIDDIFGEFEIDEDYMIKTKDVIGLFVAVKEEPAPVEEAPEAEPEEDADAKKKKKKKKKASSTGAGSSTLGSSLTETNRPMTSLALIM